MDEERSGNRNNAKQDSEADDITANQRESTPGIQEDEIMIPRRSNKRS